LTAAFVAFCKSAFLASNCDFKKLKFILFAADVVVCGVEDNDAGADGEDKSILLFVFDLVLEAAEIVTGIGSISMSS
jgi:hypothetical protein